jgi:hypothetical protein
MRFYNCVDLDHTIYTINSQNLKQRENNVKTTAANPGPKKTMRDVLRNQKPLIAFNGIA